MLLPVAGLFMTSEKDAKGKKHENNPKGTDMKWFPIYQHPTKGCTPDRCQQDKERKVRGSPERQLQDNDSPQGGYQPRALRSQDGRYLQGLHRNDVQPLAKADIDNTLQNDPNVTKVVKDVEYSLKYYDCTAVLTYNPKTNHMVDLYQYMHVLITGSGKVLGSKFNGSAVLDNFL